MATLLGSLTQGGGTDFFGEGDAAGSKWTAVATGSLDQVRLPVDSTADLKIGVYSDSGGSPGTLLGTSNLVPFVGSPQTITATFSTPVAITSGTDYWLLLLQVDTGTSNFTLAATGGYVGTAFGAGVTTFPSPFGSPGFNNGSGGAIAMIGEGTLGGGGTDATVTAVVLDGTGDIAVPAVTAGSTVTSPALDGTGDLPAPAVVAGSNVTAPALDGTGDLVAPAVGSTADATVVAVVLDATGDVAVPGVAGHAEVTAVPMDATADIMADLPVSVDVEAVTMDATGDLPAPVVSSVGGGGVDGTVVAVALDATADVAVPSLLANAEVVAPTLDGTGDLIDPSVSGGTPPAGGGGARLLLGTGS